MEVCLVRLALPTTSITNSITNFCLLVLLLIKLKERIINDKIMNLSNYSDKSFVITGNTKEYKEELKEMGGKWNSKLTCGSGWIFSLTKKNELEAWLAKKTSLETQPKAPPPQPQQKQIEKMQNNDYEDLLNDFVKYLEPEYKNKKKLVDIICDFSMLKLNRQKLDDDLDTYFSHESIVLYTHFFTFMGKKKVSHYIYQNIDKDKFIEHGLIHLL